MKTNIETSDIVLAATLKVLGYHLDKIAKDGTRGVFNFLDVDADVLKDYDLGKTKVEPVTFNGAIRTLTTAARRTM